MISVTEQTRYTDDDGTDRLEFPGEARIMVAEDRQVSWTSEDLVQLGGSYQLRPEAGESLMLDFVFVTSEENSYGIASVTIRTFNCSDGDPSDLDSCAPLPDVLVSAVSLWMWSGISSGFVSDENGEVLVKMEAPTKLAVAIPADQTCYFFRDESVDLTNLVPNWDQRLIWVVSGDEVVLDVVFIPGPQVAATPALDDLTRPVAEAISDPCTTG